MSESLIDLAGLRVGAERFLAAVLDTAAQPIYVVDADGAVRFANPAALATLGYEHLHELSGRDSHATIHHRHKDGRPFPAAECPLLRPLATGERVANELDWFIRRDGSMVPVSYVSVPFELEDGRGVVVAFNDIEDRLHAERVLREHGAVRRPSRRRCGGSRCSSPGARSRPRCSRPSPGRSATSSAFRWSPYGGSSRTGRRPSSAPGATDRTRSRSTAAGRSTGRRSARKVRETGRPARIDDFADVAGTIAEAARTTGISSCAGAPIVVDGEVWGAMSTDAIGGEPLPADIEDRLVEFTQLVAATFSTTARQAELGRLADEQAALRRVATLVAAAYRPASCSAPSRRRSGGSSRPTPPRRSATSPATW